MIIYEVNCLVEQTVVSEFSTWLSEHVAEITALDGFIRSEILSLLEDDYLSEQGQDTVGFSIRYQLTDQTALGHYLKHHAPAFRQDGLDRFGGNFTAYRRVLSID